MQPFPKGLNPETLEFWIQSQSSKTPFDTYLTLCSNAGLRPTSKGSPNGGVLSALKQQRRILIRWLNLTGIFQGFTFKDIHTVERNVRLSDNGFTITVHLWLRKSDANFIAPLIRTRFKRFSLYNKDAVYSLRLNRFVSLTLTNPFLKKANLWHFTYKVKCPYLPSNMSEATILRMWSSVSSNDRLIKTVRNV